MNETTPFQAESGARQFFLVDHGAFYGKEITSGIVFASGREEMEQKFIRTIAPGDLFFHLSPSGISAIGKAVLIDRYAPAPFWRRREEKIGERGYTVKIEVFLLSKSVPLPNSGMPYISALSKGQAEALFARILANAPDLAHAEWIKAAFGKVKI